MKEKKTPKTRQGKPGKTDAPRTGGYCAAIPGANLQAE